MEIINMILSCTSLAVNVMIMINLIKMNKNLKDLEDCYIDVNMDTLMRDTDFLPNNVSKDA